MANGDDESGGAGKRRGPKTTLCFPPALDQVSCEELVFPVCGEFWRRAGELLCSLGSWKLRSEGKEDHDQVGQHGFSRVSGPLNAVPRRLVCLKRPFYFLFGPTVRQYQ